MAKQTDARDLHLLQKLTSREINGCDQHQRRTRPVRLFRKIPKRLCYRLSGLVSQSVLEEGHVFLGFTKCGQFVVSYTCQMDAEEQSGLPFYMYKLQWWWFVPSSPLRKVSEVRLFGDEDILQDLYILFCEWPEDSSQVLVFGHSLPGREQESCQCYLTITAIPTLAPCKPCRELRTGPDDVCMCLRHSFCFHTKYELTPPFPMFCPRVQLKCNGQVILNTGDSIVALHIDLSQLQAQAKGTASGLDSLCSNKTRECLPPDRNKDMLCCSPEPNREFVWSTAGSGVPLTCDVTGGESAFITAIAGLSKTTELCENVLEQNGSDSESQKENSSKTVGQEVRIDRTRSPRSPKNILSQSQKSPTLPVSPAEKWFECRNINHPTSPQNASSQSSLRRVRAGCSNTEVHATKDLYNFDSDDSEDNSYSFMCPTVPKSVKCKSTNGHDIISHPQNLVISPNIHVQRQINFGSSKASPLLNNSQALNCHQSVEAPRSIELIQAAKTHPAIQRSFFSPSNSENSFGGTSSSADSVIVQVNDSRTVTHSWRKFSYHGDTAVDSTLVIEDDFDLSYRSVLPADIRGTKNKPLSLSLDPANDGNKEQICVKQMTFDIEHYMEEAIRGRAKWEDRYIAFTNYDLQIIDVYSDRNEVLAKVFALISAREENFNRRNKRSKGQEKLYQTSFTFEINVASGAYETLLIEDLRLIDEKDLRSKEWKPGFRECAMLRRQTYIPQSARCVRVLSNESVFKGKSLQMILFPEQFTAIIL